MFMSVRASVCAHVCARTRVHARVCACARVRVHRPVGALRYAPALTPPTHAGAACAARRAFAAAMRCAFLKCPPSWPPYPVPAAQPCPCPLEPSCGPCCSFQLLLAHGLGPSCRPPCCWPPCCCCWCRSGCRLGGTRGGAPGEAPGEGPPTLGVGRDAAVTAAAGARCG